MSLVLMCLLFLYMVFVQYVITRFGLLLCICGSSSFCCKLFGITGHFMLVCLPKHVEEKLVKYLTFDGNISLYSYGSSGIVEFFFLRFKLCTVPVVLLHLGFLLVSTCEILIHPNCPRIIVLSS